MQLTPQQTGIRARKATAFCFAMIAALWLWNRHNASQIVLPGKRTDLWAFQGRVYTLDQRADTARLICAPGDGGRFASVHLGPLPFHPYSLLFADDALYYLAQDGQANLPGHQSEDDRAPSEYLLIEAHGHLAHLVRHTATDSSLRYWPGLTLPRCARLWRAPWSGGPATEVPLGAAEARPICLALTPHFLYWVNAHPTEQCLHKVGSGPPMLVGRRGHSELIAVSRQDGRFHSVAHDLLWYGDRVQPKLVTVGDDVYWLDHRSVPATRGNFPSIFGTRLCRYDAATERVRVLAVLPDTFVALAALEGRLYALAMPTGSDAERSADTAEILSMHLDGSDPQRYPAPELSETGSILFFESAQNALWAVAAEHQGENVLRIRPGARPRIEPFSGAHLPAQAIPIGIDGGYLYWAQMEDLENWLSWSGDGLSKRWRTRIHRLSL